MLLSSTHHHINTYQYCKVLIIHFYTLGRCSVITGISGDADSLNMSPLMHYFLMWENKTATAVNINLWSMQQQQFDPKLKREILISVCCLSKCVWRSVHVLRATDGDVRMQAFSLFFFCYFSLFLFCCWWFHASYYDGANLMCILIKGSINANSTFQTKSASCVFSKRLQRRMCTLNCFNHFKVRVCLSFDSQSVGC